MAGRPICRILFAALAVLSTVMADNIPGFAKYTTGGGNVTAVRPTTIAQLKSYLCESFNSKGVCIDDTPRVIELDRTFDFRGTMGTTNTTGCYTYDCGSNAEYGIDKQHYCSGKTSVELTYDNAGLTSRLKVGSNKSIRGIGTSGWIIGTGIRILNANNVIVQNIAITDINDGIVWGGDAITIEGSDNVWIDHVYVTRIGRQMVVTGLAASTHVTISNSHFDGQSTKTSYCNGNHYWNILFMGDGDQITFSNNYLHNMAGRGPQFSAGTFHVVNNYFRDFTNLGAIMTKSKLGYILVEGNYFQNVVTPINTGNAKIYAPFWDASECSSVLGRNCVSNDQVDSGTAYLPVDTEALKCFDQLTEFVISPLAASNVATYVMSNSGVGKIEL